MFSWGPKKHFPWPPAKSILPHMGTQSFPNNICFILELLLNLDLLNLHGYWFTCCFNYIGSTVSIKQNICTYFSNTLTLKYFIACILLFYCPYLFPRAIYLTSYFLVILYIRIEAPENSSIYIYIEYTYMYIWTVLLFQFIASLWSSTWLYHAIL